MDEDIIIEENYNVDSEEDEEDGEDDEDESLTHIKTGRKII